MKHYSKLFKRVQAWVLTVAMLLPLVNSGLLLGISAADGESDGRKTITVTEGELVADNYALSDEEKALLASRLLAGADKKHTITVPDAENNDLISVDEKAKTIEVKSWTDVNGYVWKPVAARIMVGETKKEDVTLNNGKGTYTFSGNAFSVDVDFEVTVDVSADIQKNMMGAAAILQSGKAKLDLIADANPALEILSMGTDVYDSDNDGEKDLTILKVFERLASDAGLPVFVEVMGQTVQGVTKFASDDAKLSAVALNEQADKNEGDFDLSVLVSEYNATANKMEFLIKKGALVKTALIETYAHVVNIRDDLDAMIIKNGTATMGSVVTLRDFMNDWLNQVEEATGEDGWAVITSDVVRTDLTADQWARLDSLVNAIQTPTPVPETLKTTLVAAKTTIRHNMQMYNVVVTLRLNLVSGTGETTAPYDDLVKTVTVTLPKDATKVEIEAAILATGAEADAIAAWTEANAYKAGQFGEPEVQGLPEKLEADTKVYIDYYPNKYQVELTYDNEVKELYYGAFVDLPCHAKPAMSYDYLVNGEKYYQGACVTIEGNTVITRTEGKAYVATPLNQLVSSVIFGNNKNAADILTSGALTVGNQNLLIRYPDASCVVYDKETSTLTANAYPSGYQGLEWVPATYTIYNNGDTPDTKDYTGPVVLTNVDYDRVTVSFKLDLPEDGVLELVTLPRKLWNDLQGQKSALNSLKSKKGDLSQVNKGILESAALVLENKSGATADDKALAAIMKEMSKDPACMSGSNFKLYVLLNAPEFDRDPVKYYYENHVEFKTALGVLSGYLTRMMEYKQSLSDLLTSMNYGDLVENLDGLEKSMNDFNAKLQPVDERVDVSSENLDSLLAALEAQTTVFPEYNEAPDFFLTREFSVDAPTKATVKVTLTGGGKAEAGVSKTFDIGYALTQDDITKLQEEVDIAIRERGVSEFFYKHETIVWPAVGTILADGGINLTITWTPKTFEVIVNGKTHPITIVNNKITLEASSVPTTRYEYFVNGDWMRVDKNVSYTFDEKKIQDLFVDDRYTIERREIDIADELAAALRSELVDFVDGLNSSIGNGAMSFVLVENGDKYSVVMKIDGSQPNALAGAVQGLATGFVMAGYEVIAMGGNSVYADSQISLQALIDTIMNSGFSTNNLKDAIDNEGHIIEAKDIPGTIVTGDKTLGGKLITTTMQLTSGDTTHNMDFYITLDSASAQIVQIRNLFAGKLNGYLSVDFAGGKSTVNLKVPEKAYEAYLAGLLVTGYLDIDDINAMEAQIAGKFMFDVVHPLFGKDSDLDTLRYTLELFGFKPDLSRDELETLFNMVRDRHENVYTSIVFDETTGTITKTISIKGLLGTMNVPQEFTSLIKEYETGITITGATYIPQTGYDYEAAYVDVRAEGVLDKMGLIKKDQLANKKLSGASIVVLLANINDNLTFDKTTVLNLNGFTVNGNVTSTGNLTIVDSCLEQDGSVTGTVSGNVTVLSGRYTSELSDTMLKAGYEQYKDEDGNYVVHNKFYNFVKDGEGNITIEVNAGLLNPSHYDGEIPDVKFMVLDLVVDMFFNGYTTNHLEINGNLVYNLCVDDFVALYTGDRKQELIDDVRDMFDAQAIVNIMNLIIDDVTDFEALYEALANDQPLFSYDLTTGSWKIVTGRVDNDGNDYFTIGIGTGDIENRKLNIKVVGSDEDKQHLLDILEQFRDTTDVDVNLRPIEGAYDAADKDLVIGWGGSGSVLIDFTKNDNYAVMFGVLLADGLKGTATSDKLVAAIREYYETDSIYALKVAFNSVTVSQLLETVKKYTRGDNMATMLGKLGLSDVVPTDVNDLEALYAKYAKVLTAIVRRIDQKYELPESGRTLGSLYNPNPTLAGYGFSRDNIEKNIKRDVLRGFGVDLTAKVDHVSVVIRIFADDLPPVEDEIDYSALLNAIEAAQKYLGQQDKYTSDSWDAFIAAYNAALDARNSLDQDDVNAKAAALYKAIGGLKEKETPDEIDYTDLDSAIEAAKEYLEREADFLAEAWEKFMTAYNHAVDVRENSVDQTEVDKAAKDLWDAIAYLVENPAPEEDELDYSALKDMIDEAEAEDESDYTPDSWNAMTAVLGEAKAMYEGKTAKIQKEIDDMVERLKSALGSLVPVTPGPGGDDEDDPEDYYGNFEWDPNKHTTVARFGTYMVNGVYVNVIFADVHHKDGMTVGEFLDVLKDKYDDYDVDYDVVAFQADGTTEIADMESLIFTGAIIKIFSKDGTEFDQFTVAVTGDLDGDGIYSARDSFLMKLHAAENTDLSEKLHILAALDFYDDGTNEYNAKDSFVAAYKAATWEEYKAATAESKEE